MSTTFRSRKSSGDFFSASSAVAATVATGPVGDAIAYTFVFFTPSDRPNLIVVTSDGFVVAVGALAGCVVGGAVLIATVICGSSKPYCAASFTSSDTNFTASSPVIADSNDEI